MLNNYKIKFYQGELDVLQPNEYWYTEATRELRKGNGLDTYSELAVAGLIEDCLLELVPDCFGAKGYLTEQEALNNYQQDQELNSNIINQLIDLTITSNLPIRFNKKFYCIKDSIVVKPKNVSSPQALPENIQLNGNGATLIIGENVPAILIKSCANTIANFNLTFNKKVFDSINGKMYFEDENYIDVKNTYYTNSLLKLESGAKGKLAQYNRIIEVDAYNPDAWNSGNPTSTFYYEDVLKGTAFEIELNEASSYSYLNVFENCRATLLGTAIKLTHTGAAIGNNMQINANTFDVDSWGCDKYIEGTCGGSYFSGNTQSNRLKIKYIDQFGNDVLAKKPYSNPMDCAIWQDGDGERVYLKREDKRLYWCDENGTRVSRSVASGKIRWKSVEDQSIKYNGGIGLFGVPEIDLHPYAIGSYVNEETGTDVLVNDDGTIRIEGDNCEPENVVYKNLNLAPGKYSFVIESYGENPELIEKTSVEYWIDINGKRYYQDDIIELTEMTQAQMVVEFFNSGLSMAYGNRFYLSFKPRLFKELEEAEEFEIEKTNEYMINEVGGNIGTCIFENMFYDIETSSTQTLDKILKQASTISNPTMNQRLVNIKGAGNNFVRLVSQNSVFGDYHKNQFNFKESHSKNVLLTSPILANTTANAMNILPVYNSYDEALDLDKVAVQVETNGLSYVNNTNTIDSLEFNEEEYLDLANKDTCDEASVSIEKIVGLFKNKTAGRGLPIRPMLDSYEINSNGDIKLKEGAIQPYLKIVFSGKTKSSDFYYKVAPLFGIFTNSGRIFDKAILKLTIKDGVEKIIESKSFDENNYVFGFMNVSRDIVRKMEIILYFKPDISSFKKNTDNTYSFISNSATLSQFVGQLASWSNGFLNGNMYAKYDMNGKQFDKYYATKEEIEALKAEIEELKKKMM